MPDHRSLAPAIAVLAFIGGAALTQTSPDVRLEDRRADRQEDRRADRQEDRRAERSERAISPQCADSQLCAELVQR